MSKGEYSIKDEFSKLEKLAFHGKWDEDTSMGIKIYSMTRAGNDDDNHGFLHDRLQNLCLIRAHIQSASNNPQNMSFSVMQYITHYIAEHPQAEKYLTKGIQEKLLTYIEDEQKIA